MPTPVEHVARALSTEEVEDEQRGPGEHHQAGTGARWSGRGRSARRRGSIACARLRAAPESRCRCSRGLTTRSRGSTASSRTNRSRRRRGSRRQGSVDRVGRPRALARRPPPLGLRARRGSRRAPARSQPQRRGGTALASLPEVAAAIAHQPCPASAVRASGLRLARADGDRTPRRALVERRRSRRASTRSPSRKNACPSLAIQSSASPVSKDNVGGSTPLGGQAPEMRYVERCARAKLMKNEDLLRLT